MSVPKIIKSSFFEIYTLVLLIFYNALSISLFTIYMGTYRLQMANVISGFTCIRSPSCRTQTKPEPDLKAGFGKKAPGLQSLLSTTP